MLGMPSAVVHGVGRLVVLLVDQQTHRFELAAASVHRFFQLAGKVGTVSGRRFFESKYS